MNRKFKNGDIVKTKSGDIGIVGWIENKCMNITQEEGLLGISILTGSRGFTAPVKEATCEKSSIEDVVNWWEIKISEIRKDQANLSSTNNELKKVKEENLKLKELLKIYL